MNRLPQLFGLAMLGLALLVGGGVSQDAKKVDKKEDKKGKGILPPGFKDLDLSTTQKASIYLIQSDYRIKIMDLEKQIKELRKKEQQAIFKVLTEDQRAKYLESKGVESKDKKKPPKE